MDAIVETAIGLVILLGFAVLIITWIVSKRPKAPLVRDEEGRITILGSDMDLDLIEETTRQNDEIEAGNSQLSHDRKLSLGGRTGLTPAEYAAELAKRRNKGRR